MYKQFLIALPLLFFISSCQSFLKSKLHAPPSLYQGMGHRHPRSQQYIKYQVLSLASRTKLHHKRDLNPLSWKIDVVETAVPILDLDKHLLFVGSSEGKFSCFHIETGKHKWTVNVSGRIVSKPVVDEDRVYIGTTQGELHAFELETGAKKWNYKARGEILSQPSLHEDESLIVFSTSNNQVFALNAETGKWAWRYKKDMPGQLSIRGQSSPTVHNNEVYVGFSDGQIVSLDIKTGNVKWKRSLAERERFADVDTKAVVAYETLYVSSYSGSLHALDPKTGKTLWKKKLLGATTVTAAFDSIYVANIDGLVMRLNPKTGSVSWKQNFNKAGALQKPAVSRDYVFVNSYNLGILVLSNKTGKLLQILRFGSGFSASSHLDEHSLYTVSNGRYLYRLNFKKHRIRRIR